MKIDIEDLERRARLVCEDPEAYAILAPTAYEVLALVQRARELEGALRGVIDDWDYCERPNLVGLDELLKRGAVIP